MPIFTQSSRSRGASWDDVKRRWANFFQDLRMFGSLQIAHLIVWQTLRQRSRVETSRRQTGATKANRSGR